MNRYEEFSNLVAALDFVVELRIAGHKPNWHKNYKTNKILVCWSVESRRT